MNTRQAIEFSYAQGDNLVSSYLRDLTDADLLLRPAPGANHIAWQLGHLIAAENGMIESVVTGAMPKLPAGFKERHTKATASLDDPKAFLKKEEYLALRSEQRTATRAALAKLTDADFDKPAPERLRGFLKTVGEVFAMQGIHDVMHAGQWVITRRKLGHPAIF